MYPPLICILCAEADTQHAETLHHHLKPAENKGHLKVWHPGLVLRGANLDIERERRLREAALVIPLLSPDFMGDPRLDNLAQQAIKDKPGAVIPLKVRHTADLGGSPWDREPVHPGG